MSRLIQWFVENPIAANLLMVLVITGGLFNLDSLDKEVFPAITIDTIEVRVIYPGAGPREVEQQVTIRVEEAIADLAGIKEITSTSGQGLSQVIIEVVAGVDAQRLLNDVKTRVDAIITFPEEAERPQIQQSLRRRQIMSLALHGDVEEAALKQTAQRVRDELALLSGVSLVELTATRPDEIAVEVSEFSLRHYNLSFGQIVSAIRQASLDLPAGVIKTSAGDLQLQTRGQAYKAETLEQIVVDSREDGGVLRLGDVAQVIDGFAEEDIIARLNGETAVYLELYVTEHPNILQSTEQVRQYMAQLTLPVGMTLTVWRDWSELFKGRVNLLLKNAISGLLLVFVVLMLFLRPALAGWVCLGITVSFLGALWLLLYTGVSINMISLFSFLLVLGIVVDDAIIVGESIYSRQQHGLKGNAAAASGTKMVSKPVLFAVISTMVFFIPMLFIPGVMGDITHPIPVVVILCLSFSLIESMLILPSHLSHMKPEQDSRFFLLRQLTRLRHSIAETMKAFIHNRFRPLLETTLNYRYTTIACFSVVFSLSVAVYAGGWMKRTFMPIVPSDSINATVTLSEGVPFSEAQAVMNRLERAAIQLSEDPALIKKNGNGNFIENTQVWTNSNQVIVVLALKKAEARQVGTQAVSERWRELIGELPAVEDFDLSFTINQRSEAISLQVSVSDGLGDVNSTANLKAAVSAVKQQLATYAGIYDIKDTLEAGRTEISLSLKPYAETLGLSLADIALQVRQGFYGEEVQRIPRNKEDVKLMVRYPLEARSRIENLRQMRIRTADQQAVPLDVVAAVSFVPGYTTIERIDRKRSITITAEMRPGAGLPAQVVAELIRKHQSRWEQQYPGFKLVISGDMREESDFMQTMTQNFFLALLVIFGLMAVAFKSYWQPLLILTAIPFGFMGAVFGHIVMGREISMLSILGFIACAGVVVNDNLVLLDRINQLRQQGQDTLQSVIQAAGDRFRPIVLTSITTFIGLVPILSEQSTQARFLIPMVISLSFGVLLATPVTLILVPNLYLAFESIKKRLRRFYHTV